MKNINCTKTKAWHDLENHFQTIKNIHLRSLFFNDKNRFQKFSINFKNEILIDFSKNRITEETIEKLIRLAEETELNNGIKLMFSGAKINYTENRPVLHTALRNRTKKNIMIDNHNIMMDINTVLKRMKKFSELVINGSWKGCTGKSILDIVNIGIGGSDLGPYMVTEALRPYKNHLNMHYVSNIDGTHLIEVLKKINPQRTLFLIASKTFTTDETMTNANSAKKWFLNFSKDISFLNKHFIALTANINNALEFGIHQDNIFPFWEWVGGRFSLWSSVGLSIALSIGFHNFERFLDGAHSMDNHFYEANFRNNIPVLLALISIWYTNFFHSKTEAILPYDQYMHRFPAYFQQANMESNGKSIDRNGKELFYHTSPIIWGEPGTNGQHAFYQLIHQGTQLIPCDFIAPIISHNALSQHHLKLIANFFAQTRTLAFGQTIEEMIQERNLFKEKSKNIQITLPFRVCRGNQPTNSILVRKITPYNLGSLIAMYEHKIFVQGYILNIFSFDQWGVEIGKKIAQNIYCSLRYNKQITHYDSSTQGLINFYKYFHQ